MTLFDPGPAAVLTERQQAIMEAIRRAGEDGIRAPQAGAVIHALRGVHTTGDECRWCHSEGAYALRRLQELGHVRRDRHGNWRATNTAKISGIHSTVQGDFPEGY